MHMLKGGKLYRSGKVSMLETGLNDREMITSLIKLTLSAIIITMEKWKHLTWCLNCIIFYDQNILTKHVTRQTHFVIAKFKKLRILKEKDKKIQELSPSLRYWFFGQQILFLSWIWYLSLTVAPVFVPGLLKIQVKRQKQPLELFCKKWCS